MKTGFGHFLEFGTSDGPKIAYYDSTKCFSTFGSGNRSSGHYTAEVEFEGGWFICDDESIAKTARTMDRGSRDVYLLFYAQCDEAVQVAQ